jgi:hypothetical protein
MTLALNFDLARAGSSIAANIAMMAMTTSNSISVNAWPDKFFRLDVDARGMGTFMAVY